jgi:ribonucrease Y
METEFEVSWIVALPIALILGAILGYFIWIWVKSSIKKNAQNEAEEILREAKDRAELQAIEEKERTQEIEMELWTKEEPALLKMESKVEDLEELVKEKSEQTQGFMSSLQSQGALKENEIKKFESKIQELDAKLDEIKQKLNNSNNEFIALLSTKVGLTSAQAQTEITEKLFEEARKLAEKFIESAEQDAKEHSEINAKNLIDQALTRFARVYSSERGIAGVYFEHPDQRKFLLNGINDSSSENIKIITELTGCDIFVSEDMDLIGVAGFDPVRRELTRRILERCLKETRPYSADFIKKVAENIKRELLSLIKRDGDQLAKELGLQNLHPEIRQMMGSLRYRYSFTQNQYFHCAEVGWLCGLLAQELGTVDFKKARRSGMLHDLGKSMDHELDGGHAVIGANFISARGEAPDIVHAVRAHHFDETPSTDLAHLVIAADAISGSRPGARRSTVETYNQKITELQDIARSFEGVTDCFVLNGGRECRVLVNGRKVDDLAAMKLSQSIAARIESECNYPGQIRVVVVRENIVFETTRAHAN